MTQEITEQAALGPRAVLYERRLFSASLVLADTNWNTLAEFTLGDMERLVCVEVENDATSAVSLTGFRIQLQAHPNAGWQMFLADADFDASDNVNMLFASASPYSLAAGALAQLHVAVNAAHGIRFQAKIGSATATVQIKGALAPGA